MSKDYWNGVRDGIRRFAWWKDGAQQVGTCGTTLKKALEEIDKIEETSKEPPNPC